MNEALRAARGRDFHRKIGKIGKGGSSVWLAAAAGGRGNCKARRTDESRQVRSAFIGPANLAVHSRRHCLRDREPLLIFLIFLSFSSLNSLISL